MLDQMITIASDQSVKSYEMLEPISQNVGNYNTWGYKAVRFEQYIRPDSNLDMAKRTDYSPAPTMTTKRELDIAINGPGFIQVTQPDGKTAYTRNGSLAKNAQGFLVTGHGDMVGSGIQVPATYYQMKIQPDGKVLLMEKEGTQPKEIGQITLVNFPNPEGLKVIGNNLVEATTDSGAPEKIENHGLIQQGKLEQSNVNLHQAVVDILRINAGVITNLRVVKTIDDIYQQAINLRQ